MQEEREAGCDRRLRPWPWDRKSREQRETPLGLWSTQWGSSGPFNIEWIWVWALTPHTFVCVMYALVFMCFLSVS